MIRNQFNAMFTVYVIIVVQTVVFKRHFGVLKMKKAWISFFSLFFFFFMDLFLRLFNDDPNSQLPDLSWYNVAIASSFLVVNGMLT